MKLTREKLINLIKEEVASHLAEEVGQWRKGLKPVEAQYVKNVAFELDKAIMLGVKLETILIALDEHIARKGYQ